MWNLAVIYLFGLVYPKHFTLLRLPPRAPEVFPGRWCEAPASSQAPVDRRWSTCAFQVFAWSPGFAISGHIEVGFKRSSFLWNIPNQNAYHCYLICNSHKYLKHNEKRLIFEVNWLVSPFSEHNTNRSINFAPSCVPSPQWIFSSDKRNLPPISLLEISLDHSLTPTKCFHSLSSCCLSMSSIPTDWRYQ